MAVDALNEFDNGHLLTASLGIDHDKRLAHVTGLHGTDLLTHLGGEVGHLKAAAVVLLVEHGTVVVTGILVLGDEQRHFLEGVLATCDIGFYRVKA